MLDLAISVNRRKLILGALAIAMLGAAALGGLGWNLLRCDMRDYLQRAAVSPHHTAERYLFACGSLWHSRDAGFLWRRLTVSGLPFGTRDGFVALDRRPGILYLGVTILTDSSRHCWDCAWTFRRPAIYVSLDGGRNWLYQYRFRRGPAGLNNFIGLFGDPDRDGVLWAVIRNNDEITYYGSATEGRNWKRECYEYYFMTSSGCQLPENVMRLIEVYRPIGGVAGE